VARPVTVPRQRLRLLKTLSVGATGAVGQTINNPLNRDCLLTHISLYFTTGQVWAAYQLFLRSPDQKFVRTIKKGVFTPSPYSASSVAWDGAVVWPRDWTLLLITKVHTQPTTLYTIAEVQDF